MNEFNILTTYYNNKKLLLNFIDGYLHHKNTYPFLKLIIVDDGSMIHPAHEFLEKENLPDVSLYRVTEDLGFNSHGCRNLAMTVTDSYWNLLLDSDIHLKKINLDFLISYPVDNNDVIELNINSLFINKDAYFSCNGYDEELRNIHTGDTFFTDYLKKHYNFECWNGKFGRINLIHARAGRANIFTKDVNITTYDDAKGILYSPIIPNRKNLQNNIFDRYSKNNFTEKKILTFPWIKVW